MKAKHVVRLVTTEDGWQALYLDGESILQGENLDAALVLFTLNEHGVFKEVDVECLRAEGEYIDGLRSTYLELPGYLVDIEDYVE